MLPLKPAIAALVLLALAGPGSTQRERRREQDAAMASVRAGQVLPLREIEARIVPRMGGASYLGPEFDPGTEVYRLKFMRGGSVIWIDVNGRTGGVIGRSGD